MPLLSHHFLNSSLLHRPGELREICAIKDRGDGKPPRSMTAVETFIYTRSLWDHNRTNIDIAHELGHLSGGYILEDIRGHVEPFEYHGSEMSEALSGVIGHRTIDDIFFHTKNKNRKLINPIAESNFREQMDNAHEDAYSEEMYLRVVAWAVGKKTKRTYNQIRADYNGTGDNAWGTTTALAANNKIEVGVKDNHIYVVFENEKYIIHQGPDSEHDYLPCGSNGVENLYPYAPYTPAELDAIYARILRLHNFLVTETEKNPLIDGEPDYKTRILSSMHMSDFVAAIKTPETPAPKAKVAAGTPALAYA